jgi:hypothetical protein
VVKDVEFGSIGKSQFLLGKAWTGLHNSGKKNYDDTRTKESGKDLFAARCMEQKSVWAYL